MKAFYSKSTPAIPLIHKEMSYIFLLESYYNTLTKDTKNQKSEGSSREDFFGRLRKTLEDFSKTIYFLSTIYNLTKTLDHTLNLVSRPNKLSERSARTPRNFLQSLLDFI